MYQQACKVHQLSKVDMNDFLSVSVSNLVIITKIEVFFIELIKHIANNFYTVYYNNNFKTVKRVYAKKHGYKPACIVSTKAYLLNSKRIFNEYKTDN